MQVCTLEKKNQKTTTLLLSLNRRRQTLHLPSLFAVQFSRFRRPSNNSLSIMHGQSERSADRHPLNDVTIDDVTRGPRVKRAVRKGAKKVMDKSASERSHSYLRPNEFALDLDLDLYGKGRRPIDPFPIGVRRAGLGAADYGPETVADSNQGRYISCVFRGHRRWSALTAFGLNVDCNFMLELKTV